jgi:hypothetical protein
MRPVPQPGTIISCVASDAQRGPAGVGSRARRERAMEQPRVERRLAAVLAADVAGYSRLIGADEGDTLARLRAVRSDLIDRRIAENRGRIAKTTLRLHGTCAGSRPDRRTAWGTPCQELPSSPP